MSTNFNNNKRHCFDRATYGGVPHSSPKRIRHKKEMKPLESYCMKFNLGGLAAAFIIWFSLEGDPLLKAVTGLCVIASSFHCYKKNN